MPATSGVDPDTILAHVRLLRAADRLLDSADALRQARDDLQTMLERPTPAQPGVSHECGRRPCPGEAPDEA
jgi:hypothetical protein